MTPPPPSPALPPAALARSLLAALGAVITAIGGPLLIAWGFSRSVLHHRPDGLILLFGGFAATLPCQWQLAGSLAVRFRSQQGPRVSCSHEDCTTARPCETCRLIARGLPREDLP